MSYLLDGVDDYLEHAAAVKTTVPMTMACWFKAGGTANQALVAIGVNGSADERFTLQARGGDAGDPVRAEARTNTSQFADTSTGYTASAWQHGCAVFASATDRRAFVNGGSKITNTTVRTPSGVNRTRLGVVLNATLPLGGRIAEVAIWDVALTDLEVADLAAGADPSTVRPESLLAYWPLVADATDAVGVFDLTASGAVLDGDHPTISGGAETFERSAAVAGTGAIATAGSFFTVFERAAVVAAASAVATAGQRDLHRQATITATAAAVVVASQRDLHRQLVVAATGAVTSDGHAIAERSVVLVALGAIAAGPQRDLLRQAAVAATGLIGTSGQIEGQVAEHERSSVLAAIGSVTAVGHGVLQRSAAIATSGAIASTGQRDLLRAVALAASGSLETASQRDIHRQVDVSATGLISTAPELPGWTYELDDTPGWAYGLDDTPGWGYELDDTPDFTYTLG